MQQHRGLLDMSLAIFYFAFSVSWVQGSRLERALIGSHQGKELSKSTASNLTTPVSVSTFGERPSRSTEQGMPRGVRHQMILRTNSYGCSVGRGGRHAACVVVHCKASMFKGQCYIPNLPLESSMEAFYSNSV